MTTKTRPDTGKLLIGTLFLSIGVAAVVAGTSSVDAASALSMALIVGGAVTLLAIITSARLTSARLTEAKS